MKQILTSALMILVSTSALFAQAPPTKEASVEVKQELKRINKEYDEALVRGDVATLERLFAEEFVYTSTSGEVLNKQQQLELFRSGALKIASGASDGVEVRLYGDIAVMLARFVAKGEFRGQAFDSTERYTAVWLNRKGRWQLIAEQGTLVPKQ